MKITINPRFKHRVKVLFKLKHNIDVSDIDILIGKTGIIANINDKVYSINFKDI
jgi:hypothetical protein